MKRSLVVTVITIWLAAYIIEGQSTFLPNKSIVYQDECLELKCFSKPYNRFFYGGIIRSIGLNSSPNHSFVIQKKFMDSDEWKVDRCNVTLTESHWSFFCFMPKEQHGNSFKLRLLNTENNRQSCITQNAIREDDLWKCLSTPEKLHMIPYERKIEIRLVLGDVLKNLADQISADVDSRHPQRVILYELGKLKVPIVQTFYGLNSCTWYNITFTSQIIVESASRLTKPFETHLPVRTLCTKATHTVESSDKYTEIILASIGAIFIAVVVILLFRYTKNKIRAMKENILVPRDQTDLIVPFTGSEIQDSPTYDRTTNPLEDDGSHNYDCINGGGLSLRSTIKREIGRTNEIEENNIYDSCGDRKFGIT